VHEEHGHVERRPADRVGLGVALGHVVRRAPEEQAGLGAGAGQVGDRGQRGHGVGGDDGVAPPRGPQRELAARAVPHEDDPAEVEPGVVERGEVVDRAADVVERRRPAAALPAAQAAVLDVPRGPPAPGEVEAHRSRRELPVRRAPVAAVQDGGDRERTRPARHVEVGDLDGVVAGVPVPLGAGERAERDAGREAQTATGTR
jgi:hypothetical protein